MRVIAGTARSIQLKTIEGMDTRPTTDRIKETLFNMIAHGLCDCRFLDLFSGSGAIGIEALSRGAETAVFVEKNPKATTCIQGNLSKTRLSGHATVMNTDVLSALRRLDGKQTFDYVFMDPPYNHDLERQVLEYLSDSSLADDHTLIITEADLHTDFSYVTDLGYELARSKEYKTNKHIFLYKRK